MTTPMDGATWQQEVIDEVYRRRARELADRRAAGADSTTFAALIFRVGTERYGVELSELTEVFSYRGCTVVPGAPPALLGVVNVRGDLKCVADLGQILGLPPADFSTSGYVAMLRRQDGTIGLRIDHIDEVRQIDPAHLLPAGDASRPIPGSRFVKALTADTVILIDAAAALSGLGLATTEAGL